jgi:predicted deacylase
LGAHVGTDSQAARQLLSQDFAQAPEWFAPTRPLPDFAVGLAAPDLTPWFEGNTGIPGFWRFDSGMPGPLVGVVALIHGNEIAGAIALHHLLSLGVRPAVGALVLGFANLDAYAKFDPAQPTASRFVDEDMNRLWDPAVLDGPRHSAELTRARAVRPLIDDLDVLLDLHSMLWPSDELLLCGPSRKGRDLAFRIGAPALVVSDHGHATGKRLIDYPRFVDPDRPETAVLVEAGQHWEPATVETMLVTITALLAETGVGPATRPAATPKCAVVTHVITATSGGFAFAQPYRGGDVIARRNTLIAMDGSLEIRTPYDNCLLVMPSLRPSRGHTAVRLARFI